MSKKASTWKPLPPRFIPFDRRHTPACDVVLHLTRNEAFKLMKADRKAGVEWTSMEGTAAFRLLKCLTHGEQLDYSALKLHQISALQTIFIYVCIFEERRSLSSGTCLPGMCKDWYNEMYDIAAARCRRVIRDLRRNNPDPTRRISLDRALVTAVEKWRVTEHEAEVELRLAEMIADAEANTDADDEFSLDDNVIQLFSATS